MLDTKSEGALTAETCRGRAREMLNLARWAVDPTAKAEYLDLAEKWLRLSEQAEAITKAAPSAGR